MKLSVCIPTTGLSRSEHVMSLVNLGLYLMAERIFTDENQNISFRHYQSSSISNGREYLASKALEEGATHILFIDEDIAFDMDTVHGMARRKLPFVCCNYKMRFEGMPFVGITTDLNSRIETNAGSPELEECGACGFGMALIAREVFEQLPQPWFPIHWMEETKSYSTEDLPFFIAARQAGFDPVIDHVASRKIIHMGSYRYRWNDTSTKSE